MTNYYAYASSYTYNAIQDKYTLVNPVIALYSNCYNNLAGKYIEYYKGTSTSEINYTDRYSIYKVESATYDSVAKTGELVYHYKIIATENYNSSLSGLYAAPDNYGTSYYYRGNVTNNYVKFGKWNQDMYYGSLNSSNDNSFTTFYSMEECTSSKNYRYNCRFGFEKGTDMYWRIVRINGDGSVKLIYAGIEPLENDQRYSNQIIGSATFNKKDNDNAYVGYMYGTANSTTATETHSNINDSNIKTYLDIWYEKNILYTKYNNDIVDVIYCADKEIVQGGTALGYGINKTYYKAFNRINDTSIPSFNCTNNLSSYTVHDLEKGDGALTNSVGLLIFIVVELVLLQ